MRTSVQKRHYKDRVASVLIDSEVRTSAPQMLANFGIGTLVPRTRSSHKFAERSDANFGIGTLVAPRASMTDLSLIELAAGRENRGCLRPSGTSFSATDPRCG
jgi:hypothetical protein